MSVLKVRGIRHDAAASDAINLDSSGNVGIGTSTPATAGGTALAVHHSSSPRIRLTNTTTGQTSSDGSEFSLDGSDLYIENRESGNIIFYRGAERMRIDSSGRVTMPYQPVFCAQGSGATPNTSGAILQYDNALVNVGSHYNASTYRFTAPVAGAYRFSFNCLFNGAAYLYAGIYKNGVLTSLGSIGIKQGSGVETQSSCSVIASAAVNDFFDVRIWYYSSGTVGLYGGHSIFCGELIG